VEDGIPYAIDFMNPAPDADLHSVGQANFDWIVREVADLAISKASAKSKALGELRWSAFLTGSAPAAAKSAPKTEPTPAKKPAARKPAKSAAPKSSKTAPKSKSE
jgi:hypothetical protein